LKVLDLAYNKVEAIDGLDNNKELTDLWINKNLISGWSSMEYLKNLPNLETIYLIHNDVTNDGTYIKWIVENLPSVSQVDSDSVSLIKKRAESNGGHIAPFKVKGLDEASEILKSVLKKK
jgi:Leucine-rich repeat (LRR) protein